jgi:hypothetical protein
VVPVAVSLVVPVADAEVVVPEPEAVAELVLPPDVVPEPPPLVVEPPPLAVDPPLPAVAADVSVSLAEVEALSPPSSPHAASTAARQVKSRDGDEAK